MELFVNTYDLFSLMQFNEDSSIAVTNLDISTIQIQQETRHATTNGEGAAIHNQLAL